MRRERKSPKFRARARAKGTAIAQPPSLRSCLATVHERLDAVIGYLQRMNARRAAAQAQKPPPEGLGLSRFQANRYVSAALGRLQADQKLEPIESKRARIVAMVEGQIEDALNQKRTYKTKKGKIEIPDPDRKAAIAATKLLAQIELGVGG